MIQPLSSPFDEKIQKKTLPHLAAWEDSTRFTPIAITNSIPKIQPTVKPLERKNPKKNPAFAGSLSLSQTFGSAIPAQHSIT
jgi:hypothetical protein